MERNVKIFAKLIMFEGILRYWNMKTFTLLFFSLVSVLFSGVFAQNETVVLNFSATEFNGKVLLTWSVTQGNTCNGIKVLRGLDTLNYTQIGSIEGICGSTIESISYQFTDVNPVVNQTNYYRLSLGGIGFSYPVNVEVFDTGEEKYIVAPNPVYAESELIFDNENQEEVTLTFFNENGAIILEKTTTEQSVKINRAEFEQGVYFFVLKSNGKLESFSGKFSVN